MELNIGAECTDGEGNTGRINENCKCETGGQNGDYDCPDLGQNIGEDCRDELGNLGIINADCGCEI